jgi:hypothetical protein
VLAAETGPRGQIFPKIPELRGPARQANLPVEPKVKIMCCLTPRHLFPVLKAAGENARFQNGTLDTGMLAAGSE